MPHLLNAKPREKSHMLKVKKGREIVTSDKDTHHTFTIIAMNFVQEQLKICLTYWAPKLPHWLVEAKLEKWKNPSFCAVFTEICLTYWGQKLPHWLGEAKLETWKLPLFEPFSRKYASLIVRKSSPTDWAKQNSKLENSLCSSSFHENMPHLLSATPHWLDGTKIFEQSSFILATSEH